MNMTGTRSSAYASYAPSHAVALQRTLFRPESMFRTRPWSSSCSPSLRVLNKQGSHYHGCPPSHQAAYDGGGEFSNGQRSTPRRSRTIHRSKCAQDTNGTTSIGTGCFRRDFMWMCRERLIFRDCRADNNSVVWRAMETYGEYE